MSLKTLADRLLLGKGIPQQTPIDTYLDPVFYAGSIVYGDDNNFYKSNGVEWTTFESGFTGSQGDIGLTGFTGSRGPQGTSISFQGTVADEPSLPLVGNSINDAYITEDTGDLYVWNGSSWDNVGQIVGPQGLTGFTGSKGDLGYTGSSGFTGSRGFVGSIGFNGSRGFTGSVGSLGPLGYTGSQGTGFTGSRGDTGFAGSQGDLGYTGSSGAFAAVGFTGSQGDTGFTGSGGQGFTGSRGFTGSGGAGFTGSRGLIGFTGSSGEFGAVGFTGSRGEPGYVGSTGVGFTGSRGVTGFTGSGGQGFTGSQGVTGFTGSAPTNNAISASPGATYIADCAAANVFDITLTANLTVSFTNVPTSGNGYVCVFRVVQGASNYAITFTGTDWPDGIAPISTSASGSIDIYTLITINGGSQWYGFISGQDMQ